MIVINVGDKIKLVGHDQYENDYEAVVASVTQDLVEFDLFDIHGRVAREYIESDEFGNLSVGRWHAAALPKHLQTVHSATPENTHGCSEGWTAKVVGIDDGFYAIITQNTYCSSSWQTGCDGSQGTDGDLKDQVIKFQEAFISAQGDMRVADYVVEIPA